MCNDPTRTCNNIKLCLGLGWWNLFQVRSNSWKYICIFRLEGNLLKTKKNRGRGFLNANFLPKFSHHLPPKILLVWDHKKSWSEGSFSSGRGGLNESWLAKAYLWKNILDMMDPVSTRWISHFIDGESFKLLIHHKGVTS